MWQGWGSIKSWFSWWCNLWINHLVNSNFSFIFHEFHIHLFFPNNFFSVKNQQTMKNSKAFENIEKLLNHAEKIQSKRNTFLHNRKYFQKTIYNENVLLNRKAVDESLQEFKYWTMFILSIAHIFIHLNQYYIFYRSIKNSRRYEMLELNYQIHWKFFYSFNWISFHHLWKFKLCMIMEKISHTKKKNFQFYSLYIHSFLITLEEHVYVLE